MIGLRHIPRDWRYREVPDWTRQPGGGDDYRRYCKWLAQHLRSGDFPLNEAQAQYAASLTDRTPDGIAFELGDTLGFLIWERDELEDLAREKTPYADIEKEERERWQELYQADPEVTGPFEEWMIPEDDYNRICQETREADALEDELPYLDIGVRPLLALAVKQCATEAEAEEIVHRFFVAFNETARK